MKIIAIIQARMGSTRLPGKVLADLGGRSMLARVCSRVARAATVDQVVVATPREPQDQPIVDECRRLAVACFRGSEQDVLDRYYHAAEAYRAGAVVRVTADCPLIDPEVIDRVVEAYKKRGHSTFCDTGIRSAGAARPQKVECPLFSYASNTLQRTWPRGLDTEVFGVEALARAWHEAAQPHQRVHVTPYIYEHPELFQLASVTGPEDFGNRRWTVDWPEDLQFVRAVYERLEDNTTFSWRDVQRLLGREPDLAELNRNVRQKELAEG